MNSVVPLPNKTSHVVIVGAGFGGLKVARGLRHAAVRVTLIDKNNYHLFQPLLYQVATAGLSPADIASPIRAMVRDQSNTEVLMGEVIGVDTKNKKVQFCDRSISYDYLVLATGARHSYFGRDDWEKYAPGLKSIEDATLIRRKILLAFEAAEIETDAQRCRDLLTFVVVGGGPTGVEMAGSIAELAYTALARDFRHIDPTHAQIILLEAGPRILSSFPESLAQKAVKSLQKLGVDVRTAARVEQLNENGAMVSGQLLRSKTVIWAAGVEASAAGKWLQAETDRAGRIIVNADLTVPSHSEIFVIGDTAAVQAKNGKNLPGVAPVAMQEGRYVASIIKQRLAGKATTQPFFYLDKGNLATIGRSSAIADIWKLHIDGFIAWLIWLFVHIMYIVGFRNRILVLIQWAWAYVTFQRGARLITLDRSSREELCPAIEPEIKKVGTE